MRVLVVIPTYQEADSIVGLLERVRAVLPDGDILVVDDASPDGTADLAEAAAVELGGVEVLRRAGKSGLGSAYRDGFRWGMGRGYDALIEMDADGSHDPAALVDLLEAVEKGADLAIGSRYVPGGAIPDWSMLRRALSRSGCRYADVALDLGVRDATSGYRVFRSTALRSIDLDRIRADGYAFQVEMVYRLVRAGAKVAEVPITFRDREHGASKMSLHIVVEAMALVTGWGLRDRLFRRRRPPGAGAGTR